MLFSNFWLLTGTLLCMHFFRRPLLFMYWVCIRPLVLTRRRRLWHLRHMLARRQERLWHRLWHLMHVIARRWGRMWHLKQVVVTTR